MSPIEYFIFFIPLSLYLAFITYLQLKRNPVVLNGYLDKLLLGAALIFPIVLGPVRVLPLQEVMGFWGSLN
ncbi:MAG: hypothetical protein LBU65_16855, partial [Planctomycetaceae bacterium]|nr:hypothetical protein [Planctomycetaceae bacterium]